MTLIADLWWLWLSAWLVARVFHSFYMSELGHGLHVPRLAYVSAKYGRIVFAALFILAALLQIIAFIKA